MKEIFDTTPQLGPNDEVVLFKGPPLTNGITLHSIRLENIGGDETPLDHTRAQLISSEWFSIRVLGTSLTGKGHEFEKPLHVPAGGTFELVIGTDALERKDETPPHRNVAMRAYLKCDES